jgi:hypothetical protein
VKVIFELKLEVEEFGLLCNLADVQNKMVIAIIKTMNGNKKKKL